MHNQINYNIRIDRIIKIEINDHFIFRDNMIIIKNMKILNMKI